MVERQESSRPGRRQPKPPKRRRIGIELDPAILQALATYRQRHGSSIQGAVRKILREHLNVGGGSTGNS